MSYGTPYIDQPQLLKTRKPGGKGNKMPNNNNQKTAEVSKTTSKKYAKTRGEHYKDMLIVALIVGIVAFIGGLHFANQQHSAINSAVKAALAPSANAQAPAKK